jgi:hypothetical protein
VAIGDDLHVPEFTRHAVEPTMYLAVDHHGAADSSTQRHHQGRPSAARRAVRPFSDGRTVGIVIENDGGFPSLRESLADAFSAPGQVWGEHYSFAALVYKASGRNPDAQEWSPCGDLDHGLNESVFHHRRFDPPPWRRPSGRREHLPSGVDDSGEDLGASHVNADKDALIIDRSSGAVSHAPHCPRECSRCVSRSAP